MKAMLVAIQPSWLKMILDGDKKFLFRNWKVPVGTVLYFYCTKAKPLLWDIKDESGIEFYNSRFLIRNKDLPMNDFIYTGHKLNGKVVAKAVVKEWLGFDLIGKNNPYNENGFVNWNCLYEEKMEELKQKGYTDQTYALELDQVEEIEPKDITEFVSWSKLDKRKHASDETLAHTLQRIKILGNINNVKLTKPPQSRTWIYVK